MVVDRTDHRHGPANAGMGVAVCSTGAPASAKSLEKVVTIGPDRLKFAPEAALRNDLKLRIIRDLDHLYDFTGGS